MEVALRWCKPPPPVATEFDAIHLRRREILLSFHHAHLGGLVALSGIVRLAGPGERLHDVDDARRGC